MGMHPHYLRDFYGLLSFFYVYKHKWGFNDKFLKNYCGDFHTFAV